MNNQNQNQNYEDYDYDFGEDLVLLNVLAKLGIDPVTIDAKRRETAAQVILDYAMNMTEAMGSK